MSHSNRAIIDLHCDLLAYLAGGEERTPHDVVSRCSFEQLKEGGVQKQVFAVFTRVGEGSVAEGEKQVAIYESMRTEAPVEALWAIESAAGFCSEEIGLDQGLQRLEEWIGRVGKPLYVSFTWHEENRFGGGDFSEVGLKEEGKVLLDFLADRRIAVDLSHASFPLMHDILSYKNSGPVLASHANFYAVQDHPRNLPDEVAREITARGGVIGVNVIQKHLKAKGLEGIIEQVMYGMDLVGEEALAWGADFFYSGEGYDESTLFAEGYGSAGCYPSMMGALDLSEQALEALAYRNAERFIDGIFSQ